jgi:hypothetical protein
MKTPYGNTVAAIKLAELVENDSKSRSYVSKTIGELNHILDQLYCIYDYKTRRKLCLLVRDSFLQRITPSNSRSGVLDSYLRNLIVTRCRVTKRSFDEAEV